MALSRCGWEGGGPGALRAGTAAAVPRTQLRRASAACGPGPGPVLAGSPHPWDAAAVGLLEAARRTCADPPASDSGLRHLLNPNPASLERCQSEDGSGRAPHTLYLGACLSWCCCVHWFCGGPGAGHLCACPHPLPRQQTEGAEVVGATRSFAFSVARVVRHSVFWRCIEI